jgi:hypothetical protein
MLILIVRLTLKDPLLKNNLITVVITGSVSQGTSGDESGVRSLKATNFLTTKGIKAINMEGGINEYQKIMSGKEDAPKPEQGTSGGCHIY